MKTVQFKPFLIATGLAAGLGLASSAYASPVFTVNPSGIGEPNGPFQADFINGSSSELLQGNPGAGTLTATSGYLDFTGFSNGGTPVLPGVSGLGVNYQLYVTFDLAATLASGTFGAANSTYNLTSLNYSVFADTGLDSVFTQANAATNTQATVTQNTADILLGGGNLITGVAGFDTLNGAFLNSITTYGNTANGNLFFTQPNPFYNIAFNAFNNTTQGVIRTGDCTTAGSTDCKISITNAIGGIDFNRASVPEPASIALIGVGLLGLGASLRKRKSA